MKYATYDKLGDDGLPAQQKLQQSDYDAVVNFIRSSFPDVKRIEQDIDKRLKRRFSFGRIETKKKSTFRRYSKRNRNEPRNTPSLRCYNLTPRKLRAEEFQHLHNLWTSYVSEVLARDTKIPDIQGKLSRIDMHGAILEVSESKCDSYVGIKGIVIKETKNTFLIVTDSDIVKRVPKADTVFQVHIPKPAGVMEVIGNNFISRPAERSCRKIKAFVERTSSKTNRKLVVARKKQQSQPMKNVAPPMTTIRDQDQQS